MVSQKAECTRLVAVTSVSSASMGFFLLGIVKYVYMEDSDWDAVEVNQYDVMRYEQILSEFLNVHSDFEDQLSEWGKGLNMHGERMSLNEAPESEMSIANAREAHPLFSRIATTREETNRYFTTGDIRMLLPVVDVINAGRAIEVFNDLGVIEADETGPSIAEEYVQRLLNRDETLDALFELEMASIFHRHGFNTNLVKEGSVGGRDIVVTEDDTEVSIECKRKANQVPFDEKMEITGKTISNKVWNQIDIGKDSFALRISSDTPPKDQHIDPLADAIAELLRNRLEENSVTVDGETFHIELIDYYEGERMTEYEGGIPKTSSEIDELRKKVDPLEHLNHEIDSMDTEGHGDVQIFVNEMGQVVVMNAYLMEFDFPKYDEIKLNDWVMNTIRSASSQVSGFQPSVVFIDLPYIVIEQMLRRETESYHGGKVNQWERLVDEQIIGLLNKSSSLNAIVFSSHSEEHRENIIEMGRPIAADSPIHSVFNIDPEEELPSRVKEFIEGSHVDSD